MKGFIPIIAIVILAVILAIGGGIYYGATRRPAPPPPLPSVAPESEGGAPPAPVPPPAGGPEPAPPPERPTACIELYDPVCGVDGKTYSNECFAGLARVAVQHSGECVKPETKPMLRIEPAPPPPPLPSVAPESGGGTPPAPQALPEPVWFRIEADDSGFYPQNAISVPRGVRVAITFVVRETNVYFGGLDFRSPKFKTESVKPGGQTQVEFTADDSFIITSYWPASGVRKADLRVEVH